MSLWNFVGNKEPLEDLNKKILSCQKCKYAGIHTIGYGKKHPKVMFVLQNPNTNHDPKYPQVCCFGKDEQQSGYTGWMIEEALKILKLKKEDFYFTNIVKCASTVGQIYNDMRDNCVQEFFEKEVAMIDPGKIVAMGSFAFNWLKGADLPFKIEQIPHPAYFLRQNKTVEEYADVLRGVLV